MTAQESCSHPHWKRVVIHNPTETWDDLLCLECGVRVPWQTVTITKPAACKECAKLEERVRLLTEALAFYANPGQWDDFVLTRGLDRVDVGAPRVLSVPVGWMKTGYDKAQRALIDSKAQEE